MRARSHLVASISFRDRLLICSCGAIVIAPSAEELADRYQLHRVERGAPRRSISHTIGLRIS